MAFVPLVMVHAKILALSFLGNLQEFFGDSLPSNIGTPHSTTPWHELCPFQLSFVSLLSVSASGSAIAYNFSVGVT